MSVRPGGINGLRFGVWRRRRRSRGTLIVAETPPQGGAHGGDDRVIGRPGWRGVICAQFPSRAALLACVGGW